MIKSDILEHITQQRDAQKGWWYAAAIQAMAKGHYCLIDGRREPGVYMARFWLSSPKPGRDDWSATNSSLLHWIIKSDDEDALHDHPWAFRTQILSGGYYEHMSSGNRFPRRVGDVLEREAVDAHCVKDVLPDTWTLVTTSDKVREWGFWTGIETSNPEWQGHKEFLTNQNQKEK